MESKYITIREIEPNKRTKRWEVINVRTNECCGIIRWHGPFRGYCFFPTNDFLFDAKCLTQIAIFLLDHARDRV